MGYTMSAADHGTSPPVVTIPRDYNAADDLIGRNLTAGRGSKVAIRDDSGEYTYAQLAERINRFANVLGGLGVNMENRAFIALYDSIDFPAAFLGCIKAGVVPIAANTLLTAADYDFMLNDCRASVLVVSAGLLPVFQPLLAKAPHLKHVIVSGECSNLPAGMKHLSDLMAQAAPDHKTAPTCCDDACFWLYSSGSTGKPKGTVHIQSSLILTAELYAKPVLGICADDTVFSAAKLFFAYGLGNGLTFPLSVGATAVLMAERPTPVSVGKVLRQYQPTIFYGVPTLYAAMLASPDLPRREELPRLRRCTSAGEALPADIGRRWQEHTGIDILDGIGSTEMLHIFLSNRPGDVRYGSTGKPVPGYELRLVDEAGQLVTRGNMGELQVNGPSSAIMYWNNREKSLATFNGPWTRCGDKYVEDEDGYFIYCGRSDDMLKVSGIYVSPFEVEAALMTHPAVLEAAVVGAADEDALIKPKAYIVLKTGMDSSPQLAEELQVHVKSKLAPYKYPRWIEFIPELPKTATGKIQRFKLRGQRQGAFATPES
ncbi:MAG: benzoate-CoA ligase family protein [Betaproteobacteria bacterium]|nr:benzoate-CoA ligase family protein [Betaproteobacteria bacterium]